MGAWGTIKRMAVVRILLGLVWLFLSWAFVELFKDAIFGWVNAKLGGWLGVTEAAVISNVLQWGIPLAGAALASYALYWVIRRQATQQVGEQDSVIETAHSGFNQKTPDQNETARDVWLKVAITKIVIDDWNDEKINGWGQNLDEDQTEKIGELLTSEIRQAAFDGNLPIWGKRGFQDFWEPLPSKYWQHYNLDYFSFFKDDPAELRTEQVVRGQPKDRVWTALKTSKAVVDDLWPSLSRFVRVEEALFWIVDDADWSDSPPRDRNERVLPAAVLLRQAARDGEITIRGRKEVERDVPWGGFDPTWEDIDKSTGAHTSLISQLLLLAKRISPDAKLSLFAYMIQSRNKCRATGC